MTLLTEKIGDLHICYNNLVTERVLRKGSHFKYIQKYHMASSDTPSKLLYNRTVNPASLGYPPCPQP